MSGKIINMAENKKHTKVVNFSFNYSYYDSWEDTINNFMQAIINAATLYNETRKIKPSATYDLNNTSIIELDNTKRFKLEEDKESL